MTTTNSYDVLVIGGGVAGSTAGVFTSRAGLETLVIDPGESMLHKNAHLENFPGFPLGVDSELFLELLSKQVERAGCTVVGERAVDVDRHPDSGFVVKTEGTDRWAYQGEHAIAATAGNFDYLSEVDVETIERDGSVFLQTDGDGRTSVDGLYAAGRIAGIELQAVIAAGHGAEVATTVVDDADVPLAHDWIVPEGHFTDRGLDVPPGCEEISSDQRADRRERSLDLLADYVSRAREKCP